MHRRFSQYFSPRFFSPQFFGPQFFSSLLARNLHAGDSPARVVPNSAPPRSASYRSAHGLLSLLPQQDASEHLMRREEHALALLWAGDGEAVERWNELFAGRQEVGTVFATVEGSKEHLFLSYSGCKLQAPVGHDRDDELVVVLTLNRLVRDVTELRCCIDSHHAGDLAFLALTPAEWTALETEFGAPALAHRFMPLPDSAAAFWPRLRQAVEEVRVRRYGQAA